MLEQYQITKFYFFNLFQTGLSHLCSSGLAPAIDILTDVPEVDVNIPDKEGNTPLIFAAQAGNETLIFFVSLIHKPGYLYYKSLRLFYQIAIIKEAFNILYLCMSLSRSSYPGFVVSQIAIIIIIKVLFINVLQIILNCAKVFLRLVLYLLVNK